MLSGGHGRPNHLTTTLSLLIWGCDVTRTAKTATFLKEITRGWMTKTKVWIRAFQCVQWGITAASPNKWSKWLSESTGKYPQLHFTCSSNEYNLLLSQGRPPPAERTLRKRIKYVQYEPGGEFDVFKLIICKVASMKEWERKCVRRVDEMQLYVSMIQALRLLSDMQP